MRRKITITVLCALFATRSFGIFGLGDVVHDPILNGNLITMNASQLAQWAEAIKRYEEQILNQIENIEKLKQLGDIQNAIAGRIGDWKGVYDRARSIQLRSEALGDDFGINYDNAVFVDYGQHSLYYTGSGNFTTLDITTRRGVPAVSVREQNLRRYTAVENLYDNATGALDTTGQRRDEILAEIASTSEELARAQTQAEADKLKAKMQGLQIALQNVQDQRNEVMQRMLLEHTLNENQRQKEEEVNAAVANANSVDELTSIGQTPIGGTFFRRQ